MGHAVVGRCRGGVRRGGACCGGTCCRESLPKQSFLPGKGIESNNIIKMKRRIAYDKKTEEIKKLLAEEKRMHREAITYIDKAPKGVLKYHGFLN